MKIRIFFACLLVFAAPIRTASAQNSPIIHFAYGSFSIQKDSKPILEDLVNILKARPSDEKVIIIGHCEDREKQFNDQALSLKRAEQVKAYFVKHGLDPNRFVVKAYGAERPMASNETDPGRALNRRVDFQVEDQERVEKNGPPPSISFCKLGAEENKQDMQSSKKTKDAKIPGVDAVIFDKSGAWIQDCSGQYKCAHFEFWTPSPQTVQESEKGIRECIQKYSGIKGENISAYKRQYVGVVHEKSQLLWVNFLGPASEEWKTKAIVACGGGSSFFNLLYDPAKGQCYNFSVNAPM